MIQVKKKVIEHSSKIGSRSVLYPCSSSRVLTMIFGFRYPGSEGAEERLSSHQAE